MWDPDVLDVGRLTQKVHRSSVFRGRIETRRAPRSLEVVNRLSLHEIDKVRRTGMPDHVNPIMPSKNRDQIIVGSGDDVEGSCGQVRGFEHVIEVDG